MSRTIPFLTAVLLPTLVAGVHADEARVIQAFREINHEARYVPPGYPVVHPANAAEWRAAVGVLKQLPAVPTLNLRGFRVPDEVFAELKADGTLAKLSQKWIGADISK